MHVLARAAGGERERHRGGEQKRCEFLFHFVLPLSICNGMKKERSAISTDRSDYTKNGSSAI